jgi:hypothetical protein
MLTDMSPSAGQFYGTQIPAMGMNITNITNISSHIQKPNVSFFTKSLKLKLTRNQNGRQKCSKNPLIKLVEPQKKSLEQFFLS